MFQIKIVDEKLNKSTSKLHIKYFKFTKKLYNDNFQFEQILHEKFNYITNYL